MAATDRKSTPALSHLDKFVEKAAQYNFGAAMRIIECAYPDAPRLGESKRPSEDAVRVEQHASLKFSGKPVHAYEPAGVAPRTGTVRVNYPGLFGPNGPLPLHLTEHVVDRARHHGDRAVGDFINLFQHRLLSVYWRALASSRPTVHLDRDSDERFARYYACFGGFARADQDAVEPRVDRARRHWASHFARPVRNTAGLESILSGFFGAEVRVEEFVGSWLDLPTAAGALGERAALGSDTFLGESFWDCSQSVRIVIADLDRAQYDRLLPSGESWRLLEELVASYLGDEFAWDAQLSLREGAGDGLRLDGTGRLGWTAWIQDDETCTGIEELVLRPGRPFHDSISDEQQP